MKHVNTLRKYAGHTRSSNDRVTSSEAKHLYTGKYAKGNQTNKKKRRKK
jgi:hypothetical protein